MNNDDFEWDPQKVATNHADHGISFEVARYVFDDPAAIEALDDREDYGEDRFNITGMAVRCTHLAIGLPYTSPRWGEFPSASRTLIDETTAPVSKGFRVTGEVAVTRSGTAGEGVRTAGKAFQVPVVWQLPPKRGSVPPHPARAKGASRPLLSG